MLNSVVCVDASLALKLVFAESDSAAARAQWQAWLLSGAVIIAPTLWAYEVTSVIRNRAHRKLLSPALESEAVTAIHKLPVQLLAPPGLHWRAWQLARQLNRPAAYDAHYLALAEMASALFWTADRRLYNSLSLELDWVRFLGAGSAPTAT